MLDFGRHKGKESKPVVGEQEENLIARMNKIAKDTPAERCAELFGEGIRTGVYQNVPDPANPAKMARTSALGSIIRSASEIGHGTISNTQRAMIVMDPPDGVGAGMPKIGDVQLEGVPKELTMMTLLGMATNFTQTLHHPLRIVVLMPMKLRLSDDKQSADGQVSALYAWLDVDDQVKFAEMTLKIERRNGKWITTNEPTEKTLAPDATPWTQTMRSMFTMNKLVAPIHPYFRVKD